MKCGRASPYGQTTCQLEKGHEGTCFDGLQNFIENINALGRDFIIALNNEFQMSIPITEETTKAVAEIVDDNIDSIMDAHDLHDCDSCDERRSDEPRYNEGYD